jgi:AcrR family transcriptional regulator
MEQEAGQGSAGQRRKRSGDRIAEIVDLAEAQLLRIGALPLSIQEISEAMGSSRALVYAYFSDQNELVDAVARRNLERLRATGFEAALASGDPVERTSAAAEAYLEHVIACGPVLHYVFRDAPRSVQLSPSVARYRDRALRRLAGGLRTGLSIGVGEALVLVEMLVAIPEELARLVRRGNLSADDARSTCRRLVVSGIEALRPSAD